MEHNSPIHPIQGSLERVKITLEVSPLLQNHTVPYIAGAIYVHEVI